MAKIPPYNLQKKTEARKFSVEMRTNSVGLFFKPLNHLQKDRIDVATLSPALSNSWF